MRNNVAFGTTTAAAPVAAPAAAPLEAVPGGNLDASGPGPSSDQAAGAAQPADAQWQAARAARERFERLQNRTSAGPSIHDGPDRPGSVKPGQTAERPGTAGPDTSAGPISPDGPTGARQTTPQSAAVGPSAAFQEPSKRDGIDKGHAAAAGEPAPDGVIESGAPDAKEPSDNQPAGGMKRTTQDAAAAARERYLARKRKAPADGAG